MCWNLCSQLCSHNVCCRNVYFYDFFHFLMSPDNGKRPPPQVLLLVCSYCWILHFHLDYLKNLVFPGQLVGQMASVWCRCIKMEIPSVIEHCRATLSSLHLEASLSSPDVPTHLFDTPVIDFYLFCVPQIDWLAAGRHFCFIYFFI